MKTSLILVALALFPCLAYLFFLGFSYDGPNATSISDTFQGPSFEVRAVMPRLALPLFGILPDRLVTQLDATPRESGFDHATRGAEIGSVGHDHLELSADGWDLSIQTDGEGRIAPGTRLMFPVGIGGRQMKLRCRPMDRGIGYLRTTTRAGADELDGRFLVKLATCEDAGSGKTIDWPPAPITTHGSFEGLPDGHS